MKRNPIESCQNLLWHSNNGKAHTTDNGLLHEKKNCKAPARLQRYLRGVQITIDCMKDHIFELECRERYEKDVINHRSYMLSLRN